MSYVKLIQELERVCETYDANLRKVAWHVLYGPHLSPRQDEAVRLYEKGLSFVEIAWQMGIGVACVKSHLKKSGKVKFSTYKDPGQWERNAAIYKAIKEGSTYSSQAKIYGISTARVGSIFHSEMEKRKLKAELPKKITASTRMDLISPLLTVRTANALKNAFGQHATIGDVIQATEAELMRIPNFGWGSLKELVRFLGNHKLKLGQGMSEQAWREFKDRLKLTYGQQYESPYS
jgi:hypothetical protein